MKRWLRGLRHPRIGSMPHTLRRVPWQRRCCAIEVLLLLLQPLQPLRLLLLRLTMHTERVRVLPHPLHQREGGQLEVDETQK